VSSFVYVLTGIVVLLGAAVAYLWRKLLKAEEKRQTAQAQLDVLTQQANGLQLQNLEARLNPHLLRNILNSIQSHAYQTYFSLHKLSNVLDYLLYETRQRYVTPQQEIEFALNLIEINKIKVSPLFALNVKTRIDEDDPMYIQRVLAPLISIDLIENAFKHADLQRADAFISVVIELKEHAFSITVSNKISSKPGMPKEKGGIGAETLVQRLRIIYGDNFKLNRFVENDTYIAHLKIDLLEHKAKMLAAR